MTTEVDGSKLSALDVLPSALASTDVLYVIRSGVSYRLPRTLLAMPIAQITDATTVGQALVAAVSAAAGRSALGLAALATLSQLTSTSHIADTIVTLEKLAALADGSVIIGDGSNRPSASNLNDLISAHAKVGILFEKGADLTSASALAPGSDGNYFDVTGTNTITSINSLGVGTVIRLHFDDALLLTHDATNLVLPTGANITTAAGDEAAFVEYASGDWRCVNYMRADGTPLSGAGGGNPLTADLVTDDNHIYNGDAAGLLIIAGGSGVANGANLHLYGASHATNAGDINLRTSGSAAVITYDHSATHLYSSTIMGVNSTTRTSTFTALIDKKYLLNFTSAAGDADLPTAVGNENRQILLIAASTMTEIVTVDPNGSETIDGADAYKMAAGDMLLIQSDGSNWLIAARKGLVYVYADSNAGQSVTAGTEKLEYEDNIIDVHQAWSGNNQFTAPRAGVYGYSPTSTVVNATTIAIRAVVNGTFYKYSHPRHPSANEPIGLSGFVFLDYGDTLDFAFTGTQTRSAETTGNVLEIRELM